MYFTKPVTAGILALSVTLTAFVFFPVEGSAQGSTPSVSVVSLQTQPGPNGSQMVVTPRGMVVPLPGAGSGTSSVQIYMGSQGGYWYVDKTGQTVDLTQGVAALQARVSQNAYSGQMPQYAPDPYATQQPPVTVNNYTNQTESGSSNSGGSGTGTAVAAGLAGVAGMATGMAMGSMWNNVPYGTPYYYGAGGHPYYYGNGGKPVYVNNSNKNVNVNTAYTNTTNVHANNLQQQQDWYNKQVAQNPNRYQNAQAQQNPFVRQDAGFAHNPTGAQMPANAQAGGFGGARQADGGGFAGARQGDGGGFAGARQGDGGGFAGARQGDGGGFAGARQGDGGGRFGGGREGGGGGRFGGGGGGGRFGGGGGRRGR